MEENELNRSSSHSQATALGMGDDTSKPLMVRIKRSRQQIPIESLWLEVSERPTKRLETELQSLNLSHSGLQVRGDTPESKPSRLLFHHVDTVASFGTEETCRVDFLLREFQDESRKEKHRTWVKSKQSKLPASTSRDKHQEIARKARFEQVWRRRKEVSKQDSLSELFHLYDIVRVDLEDDTLEKQEREVENRLLQDYLPLLKECIPLVAAEVETSCRCLNKEEEDDYVFDVYALGDQGKESEIDTTDYPMIQVVDDEDLRWEVSSDSEYDSEDSNDENNPMNDYPEDEDISDQETASVSSDSEGVPRKKFMLSDAPDYEQDFVEVCEEDWDCIEYGSSEDWDEIRQEDE